jgi:hypothetical protein
MHINIRKVENGYYVNYYEETAMNVAGGLTPGVDKNYVYTDVAEVVSKVQELLAVPTA